MWGGASLDTKRSSLNGTGSLYSPLPNSGISEELKQGADVVNLAKAEVLDSGFGPMNFWVMKLKQNHSRGC